MSEYSPKQINQLKSHLLKWGRVVKIHRIQEHSAGAIGLSIEFKGGGHDIPVWFISLEINWEEKCIFGYINRDELTHFFIGGEPFIKGAEV